MSEKMQDGFLNVVGAFAETINERYIADDDQRRAIITIAVEDWNVSCLIKGSDTNIAKLLISILVRDGMLEILNMALDAIESKDVTKLNNTSEYE